MSKILIVYGSTTGNTQALAEQIGGGLTGKGHEVTVQEAGKTAAEGLCEGWDMVLMGCSAWGDDEIVLQDDFEELFQQFDKMKVEGCKCAAFATGDSAFTYFCGSADMLEGRLEELGGKVVASALKVEGYPSADDGDIAGWVDEVAAAL